MTEYELLNAAQGQSNIALVNLTAMFSIITAYLVVGFFIAHRVSFAMALFVTALFAVWALATVMLEVGTFGLLINIVDEMRAQAHAGKAFSWWPELASGSGVAGRVVVYAILIVMIVASFGAVYFFFECRWRNMKADAAMKA